MQNLEFASYMYPIECKENGLRNAKRKQLDELVLK